MRRPLDWYRYGPLYLLFSAVSLGAGAGGHAEEGKPEDPVGCWKLRCVSPDGKARECLLVLAWQGNTLQGHHTSDGVTRAARGVAFDPQRRTLGFQLDGTFARQVYTLDYQGQLQGDVLKGTVRWSYRFASGTFDFEGQRQARRVTANP